MQEAQRRNNVSIPKLEGYTNLRLIREDDNHQGRVNKV